MIISISARNIPIFRISSVRSPLGIPPPVQVANHSQTAPLFPLPAPVAPPGSGPKWGISQPRSSRQKHRQYASVLSFIVGPPNSTMLDCTIACSDWSSSQKALALPFGRLLLAQLTLCIVYPSLPPLLLLPFPSSFSAFFRFFLPLCETSNSTETDQAGLVRSLCPLFLSLFSLFPAPKKKRGRLLLSALSSYDPIVAHDRIPAAVCRIA